MEQLIATIEKGQPFFNAIARNKYLKAIRDGFISVIPIIIFSSIFCLVASVPNIWGFYWPDDINNALWKCYNYSMGILAIACAATTAKHFADAQNRDLPKNNQINFISCMCAAIIGFLLLSSDTIATDAASGFNTTYLGSKGLLTAFIAAFVTGIIYKFFIKRNITVKMPEQVPPNISQTFKDIIPFSVCITVFWVFDIAFRAAFGFCFAQGVIQVFQPLFTAADGYIGLAVIYGAMSLFWFVGVHGPSIVEPAIAAALVANMTDNLAAFQAGQHASAVLTQGAQYFVVCMGGTGATLVLVFMFCFLAKSQEMRAVGKAAIVPVCFAVNEPLLFAAPIVLNPVFFVPFVFAPIANIWILKIFIDFLGMNGFMYTLPWTVPGPIGTIMGLGFQPLAFVMLALILVVDFVLYYPFFRAYDAQKCAEEAEISQEELAAKNAEKAAKLNDAFQGKADAKSVAAGAAAEAVKADSPAASAAPAAETTTASDLNGKRVLVRPRVVDAGYANRKLLRLTGLDVQENQARRLLNDLDAYRTSTWRDGEDLEIVATDWMREVFEPTVRMIPREYRSQIEPAQFFHEVLDHRWFLAEKAGHDVPMGEAVTSYIDNALPSYSLDSKALAELNEEADSGVIDDESTYSDPDDDGYNPDDDPDAAVWSH